jgi:hypothetical protein
MYTFEDIQEIKEHFVTSINIHRLIIVVLIGIIVKLMI